MKRLSIFFAVVVGIALIAGLSGSTRIVGEPQAATAGTAYLYLRVGGIGGTVTEDPAGTLVDANCPRGICVLAYPEGTRVTLTPSSAPGSSFQGWRRLNGLSSSCYFLGTTCQTVVTGSVGFKAAFSPVELTVASTAGGSVEIATPGGACGKGCGIFSYGSSAVVRAHNEDGYSFDGWTGICQGIGSGCRFTLFDNQSVSAFFGCHLSACSTQEPITTWVSVTITTHGPGSAMFLGRLCTGRCTRSAPQLSMVSVEARANPGASSSVAWNGSVRCAAGGRCSFPAFSDARGHGPRLDVYFR
jgi:hypothetical protein